MIVDANVHATADGTWFGTSHDASLGRLIGAMDTAGVDRAVLTGLSGATTNDDLARLRDDSGGRLTAVAGFDPSDYPDEEATRAAAARELRGRGFAGVKLHPRLGGYDLLDPRALALVDEVAGWGDPFAIWICTFLHVPGRRPVSGPVETLCEVVGRAPEVRFVLAHGGGPDLLRLATAVRGAQNALLDLSYTLTHLGTSSVRTDIAHLLGTFDERLVFGSDFPEGDPAAARAVLEEIAREAGAEGALPKVLGDNLVREIEL